MPNVLNYGRRRSRRDVFIVAAAVVIALAIGGIGVRRWRLRLARIEDQRLWTEQRRIREEFVRQLSRALGPTSNPARATTRGR